MSQNPISGSEGHRENDRHSGADDGEYSDDYEHVSDDSGNEDEGEGGSDGQGGESAFLEKVKICKSSASISCIR